MTEDDLIIRLSARPKERNCFVFDDPGMQVPNGRLEEIRWTNWGRAPTEIRLYRVPTGVKLKAPPGSGTICGYQVRMYSGVVVRHGPTELWDDHWLEGWARPLPAPALMAG